MSLSKKLVLGALTAGIIATPAAGINNQADAAEQASQSNKILHESSTKLEGTHRFKIKGSEINKIGMKTITVNGEELNAVISERDLENGLKLQGIEVNPDETYDFMGSFTNLEGVPVIENIEYVGEN